MQVEDTVNSSVPVIGVSPSATGPLFENSMAAVASASHHHLEEDNSGNINSLNSAGFSYDEVFPALPDSMITHHYPVNVSNNVISIGQQRAVAANKMRVGSSDITQIVKVKAEERKYDDNDSFGEKESIRTCKNITKDTNATIEMTISKDQTLSFLVTGKPENVNEARRKIVTHFQTQANRSIVIPKEHHKWVLGKMGQRLKDLERETETKITVPSMSDQSETINVTGTKEGIERAVHEIKTISDEQSKKGFERVTVPKIYLPFVCGPNNVQLNQMMMSTGTKITILPPSIAKDEITIAGDKERVAAVKEKVLKIVEEMEQRCTTVSVEVPKSQHKYVIGPKGTTIAEILDKTGVSVELPSSDTTNTVILRGPQERLGNALSMVCEKANSNTTLVVDVPVWIHKYIIGKKGEDIKRLKEDFPKVHVEFIDKEDKIRIEGPTEEVKVAKEKIMSKANELINQLTHCSLTVDPKHYKHIIGKNGANVNRLKEQTDAVITISSTSDSNIIRIEGSKEGVKEAKRELEEMIHKLENESEEEIVIEHRYHSSIIGQKGEKIKEINSLFNQEVQITFPNANEKKDIVKLRGPREDVEKCCRYLKTLVKQLAENRYVLEVPIYKQYHKLVIGKGGVNIRKIKEETHTKIDLPAEGEKSDVIMITGKKENVEEARDRILRIQNEQANIVNEEIYFPMSSALGNRGMLLRSITEDCNGVSIRFLQPNSNDKVSVRGPKEDVEKVKQQLQELAVELQHNSFTAEVKAKPQHHRFLIGKSGANIRRIREFTGCRIVFPNDQDENQELITIIGTKDGVKQAKEELEASIKEVDNIVEEEMNVDPKHHKQFMIRRSGFSQLQKISDDCGGISILFPRQGVASDKVILRGSHECIQAAKQRILEFVDDLENQVTIECVIPNHHHRSLMGPKFIKAQELNATYNVQIKFPERIIPDESGHQNNEYDGLNQQDAFNQNGEPLLNGDCEQRPSPSDIILITGKAEKCEAAKQALLDSVPVTETIDVPYDYHRVIIGSKGQTIRELSTRFDVHINVPQSSEHLDTITVTGSPANIKVAKEAIQDKMADIDLENEERRKKSYEVKVDVPAEYFPKIIGKKGSVINKIRDDHGVQINLPPRGSEEENTITIVGYREKAEAALEVIMKIVNELKSMVKEEVLLDARIHSRLIGARGKSIRKVMDQFKVEIKFARATDPNPDLVIISGIESDVADAKEHLLELQEEYLLDMDYETEYRPPRAYRDKPDGTNPFANANENSYVPSNGSTMAGTGFVVKGAPWEQKAPDTASTEEFPSFGGSSIQTPTHSVPWGPRR